MTRREKAPYERGYIDATRFASCFMSIDAINCAADHIERHMMARGVKLGGGR